MCELSVFTGFNKIVANKKLSEIAAAIKSGAYKDKIDSLRELLDKGKEKEYSYKKKQLPAFTPSGTFDGGRKPEFLLAYSGIVVLDIDKTYDRTNSLKKMAIPIHYTYCCFVSPGGNGLKILVRVDGDSKSHVHSYNAVKKYYEKSLNITIDASGKDITRLCFLSYDQELYMNDNAKVFKIKTSSDNENDVEKLISLIEQNRIDITSNYEDWCNIGFALEHEFGENGRSYYHAISKFNPDYNPENCNVQYTKCIKNNNSGITIKTLFHIAKQHGITVKKSLTKEIGKYKELQETNNNDSDTSIKVITSNKFVITEEYLQKHYVIRYNVVSNKFEYKANEEEKYQVLNENTLFVRLQKENINISLNNLIALLKSDYVPQFNPFVEYFHSLEVWDETNDYIQQLCSYIKTPDKERFEHQFRKWLVRVVKTAVDDNYFNKQALVLVSTKQNSGKSTFCRFLCPPELQDYLAENIGTDKDSLVAITENFLINLDELSTAEKAEINAFKSMFSKDKVKARLTYDKRASIYVRRASFIGSTDRWEFLTDENGSVRWLCFDIDGIDWSYSKQVDINRVYSQAYFLLTQTKFEYELSVDEIAINDEINKKYQVSTPERELIQRYFNPASSDDGFFFTATDILEYLLQYTSIKLSPERIGREMKFLGFERTIKRLVESNPKYGYYLQERVSDQE